MLHGKNKKVAHRVILDTDILTYNLLMSSVIIYWTDTLQHGIYYCARPEKYPPPPPPTPPKENQINDYLPVSLHCLERRSKDSSSNKTSLDHAPADYLLNACNHKSSLGITKTVTKNDLCHIKATPTLSQGASLLFKIAGVMTPTAGHVHFVHPRPMYRSTYRPTLDRYVGRHIVRN